jgi:hypothetical protein
MDDFDTTGLDEAFAASTVNTEDRNAEPPDGEYDYLIDKSVLKNNSSGNPMLTWWVRIEGSAQHPGQVGRMDFRRVILRKSSAEQTARTIGDVRTDYHRLGITIDSVATLKARHEEAVGKRFRGRKRTKNGFTDIFVNGLLGDAIDPAVGF